MKFTMPKTISGWTVLVAVFSFIFDKVARMIIFLFKNRGSSKETEQSFEKSEEKFDKMEEDNEKRHQETKELINGIKDSFEKSFEKLVSKEMFEERIKSLKKEIEGNNKVRFIKLQSIADRAIENAKKQEIEARGMKQLLRETFKPMIVEYHKMNESKTKKGIRKNVKKILEENNEKVD